jgi:hypothetical protein
MRAALAALALLAAAPTPAVAQGAGPVVKYGKWALLAGSVGMNYLAARAHDRAEDAFEALEEWCEADRFRCDLDPGGRYFDPTSEALYQESLRQDRRARGWLFGGEGALLGAAALFVWELTRSSTRPDNIPFEPEVTTHRGTTRLGLRLPF